MAQQLNIIIVPHTHWDREWYQTFQQFRIRLVRTVDKLLDILDQDDQFSYFMLDGQTIVLDDYLEVQPEQEERLRGHIRAGRIGVGPWYLQPDEFLVSGESLIRNLQIGLQQATDFGNSMHVGYVPDCFGHIAQMPQILQGVGIDNAVFWRGVGAEARNSEFLWEAPDGTKVLVAHLADPIGYSNARHMPLNPKEFVSRVELLTAQILMKATTNTLLFMNGSDHLEPQDGLPATIEAANVLLAHLDPQHEKILAQYAQSEHSENGRHYHSIHVRIGSLPQYIEAVRPGNSNGHTAQAAEPLQILRGEMRSSQYTHLLPSVLSTRMWMKQQNTAQEHLMERWIEPLTAWAWKLGAPYPKGLVRLAWKHLLQNHPHDSICGCSIDQVHRENSVRFAQSQQIAESVLTRTMSHLASVTNTSAPFPSPQGSPDPVAIVVFNPAPGPRTEVQQVEVQFPGSLRNAALIDERGQHMPYSVVNRRRQEIESMSFPREVIAASVALAGVSNPGDLLHLAESTLASVLNQPEDACMISHLHVESAPQGDTAHIEILITQRGRVIVNTQELHASEQQFLALLEREDISTLELEAIEQARETLNFVAADLPSYGLKTFWLYPRGLKDKHPAHPISSLSGGEGGEGTAPFIENAAYRVEASTEDGTLTVTDKHTGTIFTGLHRFVDGGDVGDLYTYCPPAHDTLVTQPLEPPTIEVVSTGPVRALLRVTAHYVLPDSCADSRSERSASTTPCQIVSEIALTPGGRRIDIVTKVENKVKDHRLRVIFPVSYIPESVAAEGTFEVRMRPLAAERSENVAEWAEEPVNTFPQKRFVDSSNGKTGLAVLNRGLPEYEMVQNGPGLAEGQSAVALTLLRCVEWLSRNDLSTRRGHAGPMEFTPEAQCLGPQEFAYALVSHSGTWSAEEALVLREAQAFNTGVRAVVSELHAGQLPSQSSLIEVEPREVVVSAVKQSNDGQSFIVRVYNPLGQLVEATIRPGVAYTKAFVANLLEEQQEEYSQANPLHVSIRSGGIVTVLFR